MIPRQLRKRGAVCLAAAAACGAVFFQGCAVGPDYQRPAIDSPRAFRDEAGATNTSFAELNWWQVYRDDHLQTLIREALTNNYDLRLAATRVEQSRALAMQARSQFFPAVGYSGTVSRGRNDLFGSPYPNKETLGTAVTAVNAFWEVDLWGRVRRLNESARARFLASQEARHGVRLSLLGDVASTYFQLVELDQELQIVGRTTNSFADSLKIFTRRVEGGTASELESSRAEAALADASSAVPTILEEMSMKENQLCVLLGRPPGPVPRRQFTYGEMLPPQVPAGLPSALLERRPDLRETEQLLRSANAQVGESVAEFFPKIGLTTFLGRISPELSAFTLGGANAWGVGAEASGPLFEGGRLVGQYRQARAARDEALLRYQQTALTALQDVSDALVTRQRLEEIRAQLEIEVQALGRSVKLSTERYTAGKASYYEVLEAQQQLFPSELSLARTRTEQMLAVVSLYKALGGGWEDEKPASSASRR